MARDGVFFRRAAIDSPALSARPPPPSSRRARGAVLLVLTGSFNQLIAYTGFAVVLFSGIAGVALFVLRRQQPDERSRVPRVGLSAACRRSSSPQAR